MEVTTLSTKGQIVIPEKIRKGLNVGTAFSITKVDELIVLRPVKGLSKEEELELKQLNKAWKDIEEGKCVSYTEDKFFEQLKKW